MKSGLLNVIGLFSRDVIGWKTRVEFVNSHWSTGTAQQVFEWGAKEECVKENFFVKLFFV